VFTVVVSSIKEFSF